MADDMFDLLASLHGRFYGDPTPGRTLPLARQLSPLVHHWCGKMGTEY